MSLCNDRTGRCDFGEGPPCLEPSSPCTVDSDCCLGRCVRNTQGINVCIAQCLADGQDCNSNGECCNGRCSGFPQRCGAAPLPPRCP
jgi:hypothetical protein